MGATATGRKACRADIPTIPKPLINANTLFELVNQEATK
jgi:hypothetical protein